MTNKTLFITLLTLLTCFTIILPDEYGGQCISSLGGIMEPLHNAPTRCDMVCRNKGSRHYAHYCIGTRLWCNCK